MAALDPGAWGLLPDPGPGRRLLATPRVLGVGAGVFVLAFFLVVTVVLCLLGSRTRKPGLACTGSAAIFLVVAAVLLGSPKGYRPPPAPQGYDATVVPLALMGALVCLGSVASVAGMFVFVVRETVYARPLSYQADVLGQW